MSYVTNFPGGFQSSTDKPLDYRAVVDDISALEAVVLQTVYIGLVIYDKATGKHYEIKGTDGTQAGLVYSVFGQGSDSDSALADIITTRNPTKSDDADSSEFTVNALTSWLNKDTGELFLCTDNTAGAANWIRYVTEGDLTGLTPGNTFVIEELNIPVNAPADSNYEFNISLPNLTAYVNSTIDLFVNDELLVSTPLVMNTDDYVITAPLKKNDKVEFRMGLSGNVPIEVLGLGNGSEVAEFLPNGDIISASSASSDPDIRRINTKDGTISSVIETGLPSAFISESGSIRLTVDSEGTLFASRNSRTSDEIYFLKLGSNSWETLTIPEGAITCRWLSMYDEDHLLNVDSDNQLLQKINKVTGQSSPVSNVPGTIATNWRSRYVGNGQLLFTRGTSLGPILFDTVNETTLIDFWATAGEIVFGSNEQFYGGDKVEDDVFIFNTLNMDNHYLCRKGKWEIDAGPLNSSRNVAVSDLGVYFYPAASTTLASTLRLYSHADSFRASAYAEPTAYFAPTLDLAFGILETRDPIETDDSASVTYDIAVNQTWKNETTGSVFVCADATPGAAVWKKYVTEDELPGKSTLNLMRFPELRVSVDLETAVPDETTPHQFSTLDLTIPKDGKYHLGGSFPISGLNLPPMSTSQAGSAITNFCLDLMLFRDSTLSPLVRGDISIMTNDVTQDNYDFFGKASFDEILDLKAGDVLTWQFYTTSNIPPTADAFLFINPTDGNSVASQGHKSAPWLRELEVATYLPAGDYTYGIKSTRDPGPTDDENSTDFAIAINQVWFNETNGKTFVCQDATADNAVWNAYVTADQIPGFQDTQYVSLTDVTQFATVSETALHRFGITLAGTDLSGATLWMTVNGNDAIQFDLSGLTGAGTRMYSTDQFTALNKDDVIAFRWVPNGAVISSFGFAGGIQPTTYYAPLKDFELGIKETRDPTPNDDENSPGLFIQVNQIWHNEATASIFVCTDATVGAAVWKRMVTENDLPGFDDTSTFSLTGPDDVFVAPHDRDYTAEISISGLNLDKVDFWVKVNDSAVFTLSSSDISPGNTSALATVPLSLSTGDSVSLDYTNKAELTDITGNLPTSATGAIYILGNYYYNVDPTNNELRRASVSNTSSWTDNWTTPNGQVINMTSADVYNAQFSEGFLFVIDRTTDKLYRFDKEGNANIWENSGLESNTNPIYFSSEDRQTYLWDTANKIIERSTGSSGAWSTVYNANNDPNNTTNTLDFMEAVNGEIYFLSRTDGVLKRVVNTNLSVDVGTVENPAEVIGSLTFGFAAEEMNQFIFGDRSGDKLVTYNYVTGEWAYESYYTDGNYRLEALPAGLHSFGRLFFDSDLERLFLVDNFGKLTWLTEGYNFGGMSRARSFDEGIAVFYDTLSQPGDTYYRADFGVITGITVSSKSELRGTYIPTDQFELGIVTDRDPTETDDADSTEFFVVQNQYWQNTANGYTWICKDATPGAAVWKKHVTEDEITGIDFTESYALVIPETVNPTTAVESDPVTITEDKTYRFDIRSRMQVPRGKSVTVEVLKNDAVVWSNTQTTYNYSDSVELPVVTDDIVKLRATLSDTNRWHNSMTNITGPAVTFGDSRGAAATRDFVMMVESSNNSILLAGRDDEWVDVSNEALAPTWSQVYGITADEESFYVIDRGLDQIWQRRNGGLWSQIDGHTFTDLFDIAYAQGKLYCLDEASNSGGSSIEVYDIENDSWSTLTYTGLPTIANARGMTVDPDTGDVFLYDTGATNKEIFKFTAATQTWAAWAMTNRGNPNHYPFHMTIHDGKLWYGDMDETNVIRTIRTIDLVTEVHEDWGAANGQSDDLSRHIRGIAFRDGKLYGGDLLNDTIWSFETYKVGPASAGFGTAPRAHYLPANEINVGIKETRDPTENDDSSSTDYDIKVNQLWLNETNGSFWICKKDTLGAAVWARFSTDTEEIPPIGQRLDVEGGRLISNNGVYWANDASSAGTAANQAVVAEDVTWFMFHSWDDDMIEGRGMRISLPAGNLDETDNVYINLDIETYSPLLVYRTGPFSPRWKVSDMMGSIIELRPANSGTGWVANETRTASRDDFGPLRKVDGNTRLRSTARDPREMHVDEILTKRHVDSYRKVKTGTFTGEATTESLVELFYAKFNDDFGISFGAFVEGNQGGFVPVVQMRDYVSSGNYGCQSFFRCNSSGGDGSSQNKVFMIELEKSSSLTKNRIRTFGGDDMDGVTDVADLDGVMHPYGCTGHFEFQIFTISTSGLEYQAAKGSIRFASFDAARDQNSQVVQYIAEIEYITREQDIQDDTSW
ncbi:hypothetical protein SM033_00301 [Vibrio phage vB_VpaM_sm033]|nr:hypothetical protein SM033_00301 [Vibrio phage vB_VpaM_sm033]